MALRFARFSPLLLSPALIASCSLSIGGQLDELDTGLATPTLASLSAPCLPDGGLEVRGTRPTNTRIIAVITPATGAATETELAPVGDDSGWTGTLAIDDEGDYRVAVVAENGAGVRTTPSPSLAVRVDRTAPDAPTGTFPASAEAGTEIDVALAADADVDSIACGTGATVEGANGEFVASLAIGIGDNTFSCTATDVCGLTSSPLTSSNIDGREIETLARPALEALDPIRLVGAALTATVTVEGTTEDATAVLISIDGGQATRHDTVDDAFSIPLELPQGIRTITVVATDSDDDTRDSAAAVVTVTVLEALAPPVFTCPASPTNDTALVFSGTRQADTAISLLVDGAPDSAAVTLAEASADLTWTGTWSEIGLLGDGSVTFALRASDASGSSTDASCTIEIDRTRPAPAVLEPIRAVVDRGAAAGIVTFEGTGEPGSIVTASLDNAAFAAQGEVAEDGTFSFELTVAVAGSPHQIAVLLTDPAGNAADVVTASFSVIESVAQPRLTSPASNAFPVFTRATSVALVGTKAAGAGIKLRPTGASSDGSGDIVVTAADSTLAFNAAVAVPANGSISFCLLAFNGTEVSPLRCQSGSSPYVITNDTIAPAAPGVTVLTAVQVATVDATVSKEALAGLSVSRNAQPAVVLDATSATSVTTTLAVDLGDTTFCFSQSDKAGNVSDDACVTIRRTEAGLDIVAPATFAIVNGNTLAVDAEMLDTTATSYEVCFSTVAAPTPACQTFDADADGRLDRTVTIAGAVPAAATVTTVRICGDDDLVLERPCASRQIVRQGAPQQLSTSLTDQTKNDPQVVIDQLGFVHLAWTDATGVCSAGHSDVITSVSRAASGRVLIAVKRPTELGLATNASFEVFGTNAFDRPNYTVRAITNGVIETNETVPVAAAETRGNILGATVNTACAATDILYARFDDRGWSKTINLSDVGGDATSSAPTMVVDDAGDIHVAWAEGGNLNPDDGLAKPPAAPADGTTTDIIHRVIDGITGAISLPNVVSRQDDAGNAFVDDTAPTLAAGNDEVVVTWDSARKVLLSRFNGVSWSTPAVAFAGGGNVAPSPTVAVGPSGVAYVTWVENSARVLDNGVVGTGGDRDIVMCPLRSTDASCPINADVLVSTGADAGNSVEPSVLVTSGDGLENVHVVWTDNEGRGSTERRVLHKRLLLQASPRVIGPATAVSTTGTASGPAVAATPEGNELLVIWVDNTPTSGHAPFPVFGAVGSDRDIDLDGVFEASSFVARVGTLLPGTGSVTTATTKPTVAVTADRGAWIGVLQQTGVAGDTEIVVYPTTY